MKTKASFIHSFKTKINLFIIICVLATVGVTVFTLAKSTKSLIIDSALGKMLNVATSYGKIIESEEGEEAITSEQYTEMLSELKVEGISSASCYVLNKSGIIVYHPNAELIGKPNKNKLLTNVISELAKGHIPENLCLEYQDDETGVQKIASYYITGKRSVVIVCADETDLMAPLQQLYIRSLLIAVIVLIFAVIISNVITGKIIKPILKLVTVIYDSSQLNFTSNATLDKLCKRKDETGIMSNAVKELSESLRQVVGKIDEANQNIETNIQSLSDSSNQIYQFCIDNSSTSEEIAASMEGAADMTDTLNVHMARMQEQSEGIGKEAFEGTELSEEIAERARQLQKETIAAIENTKRLYEEIKEQSEMALSGIQSVYRINELTNSIRDISDQTSLLSLNASIEAARAGEAGRSFAVVATEISNLANSSLATVNDINTIIGDIRDAVGKMSDSLEATSEFLENTVLSDYDHFYQIGQQYYDDAGIFRKRMTNISDEIRNLNHSIQDIAGGLANINTVIAESSVGVSDIASKTTSMVDATSNNYSDTTNTIERVNDLRGIVDRFQL